MSIYKGYDKEIHIDVGTDISAATSIEVVIKDPDNQIQVQQATQYNQTTIKFDFTPQKAGRYYMQPRVVIAGKTYAGNIFSIDVQEPLA